MSDAYKTGVSYSKSQQSVQFGKKPITKMSWKTKGGCNRNHDVLVEIQLTKVRKVCVNISFMKISKFVFLL